MNTRKALIERIQSMQLGTQEMLDAAKDDATLIPFDTLFIAWDADKPVWRRKFIDDSHSVYFIGFGFGDFYRASDLRPITEE